MTRIAHLSDLHLIEHDHAERRGIAKLRLTYLTIGRATNAIRRRARAMHALEQVGRTEPRHSLWTGDIGVALYLRACLDGWDGMPVLDVL